MASYTTVRADPMIGRERLTDLSYHLYVRIDLRLVAGSLACEEWLAFVAVTIRRHRRYGVSRIRRRVVGYLCVAEGHERSNAEWWKEGKEVVGRC